MTNVKIPNRLGEFLEECLDDLRKIEKTPGYEVSMSHWHTYFTADDICLVCLGGAKLAGWGMPRTSTDWPTTDDDYDIAMEAIDYCQMHCWFQGLAQFYKNNNYRYDTYRFEQIEGKILGQTQLAFGRRETFYSQNSEQWHKEMRLAAAILKKHCL